MQSRSAEPGGVLQCLLTALLAAGAVLGAWRWLGKGSGATARGWLGNLTDSLTAFRDWTRNRTSQLGDRFR
jgi:hypothetical protein